MSFSAPQYLSAAQTPSVAGKSSSGPARWLQDFVQRRCRSLGMTQTELALRAGLTRAYLYRLLNGGVPNPGVLTLERLAQALAVSATALVRLFVDAGHCRHSTMFRCISPDDPRDAMVFVADVTVPDHSAVLPGERFTKIWAIQNVGDVPWPHRHLVRLEQSLIVARRENNGALTPVLHSYLNSLETMVVLPPVLPGQVHELAVDFVAPAENCSVASLWRLEHPDGRPCYGDKAFLQVIVTVIGA